jgi:TonB family protein
MFRIVVITAAAILAIISALECQLVSASSAIDLAANVVGARAKALAEGDGGPDWRELESRLSKLYSDSSKEADEAVVTLMSFYLGEDNGEELYENVLQRGPRMIPILKHYLNEEPVSLLARYPSTVRLERTTTVMLLKEALEVLKVRAGARHVSSTSVETSPYRKQDKNCELILVRRPGWKFADNLMRSGESYNGAPVVRADIEENGNLTNVELLNSSGIHRLDAFIMDHVKQWKYAPRKDCGVVRSNIVITIDWTGN